MATDVLVISHLEEDILLGREIAAVTELPIHIHTNRDDIRRVIASTKETLVLWNADNKSNYEAIAEVLPKYCKARNIFAVTQESIRSYPGLFDFQIFCHHFVRRQSDDVRRAYIRLAQIVHTGRLMNFANHFPEGAILKKLVISNGSHKKAVASALQNHLTQQKVGPRLAALVAQAIDELIMNAIFDAPVDSKGHRLRWNTPRSENFEMTPQEHVEVELGILDDFMGACVTDHFGSLKRNVLFETIGKHYYRAALKGSEISDLEPGMGLRGIYDGGLSLLFAGQSGARTDAMIFFRRSESHREFLDGPRLLSFSLD